MNMELMRKKRGEEFRPELLALNATMTCKCSE
jgi:hypothetical protein